MRWSTRHWVGLAAVALAGAGLLAWSTYTPVEDRRVVNDTSTRVIVYGCGSDPVQLRPGEAGPVQVNTGPPASCDVENMSGSREHRCLPVAHGPRARVSRAVPLPDHRLNCGG